MHAPTGAGAMRARCAAAALFTAALVGVLSMSGARGVAATQVAVAGAAGGHGGADPAAAAAAPDTETEAAGTETRVFEPSFEWKEVMEGQAIPAVR